jgi:type VI secretion system protein ImpL
MARPGSDVAGHFAPLSRHRGNRRRPPLLDDGLRIDGLAKEVASAMKCRRNAAQARGLAELTGAAANAAKTPPSVDDWIGGLAGDTIAVTRDAVSQQRLRRADVFDFCVKATEAAIPSTPPPPST